MQLTILCLNCQKGYRPELENFLQDTFKSGRYDFLLLQEVDHEVGRYLEKINGYKTLKIFDELHKAESQLRLLYREQFSLLQHLFLPFGGPHNVPAAYGMLLGFFDVDGERLAVGSIHLHAHFSFRKRTAEVTAVKKILKGYNWPIIFGGDFNAILPFEPNKMEKIMLPEFVRISKSVRKTLNSRYVEFGNHLTKIFHVLAWLGIGFSATADHVYVSKNFLGRKMICRKLPERVSDHSPIELIAE